MNMQTILGFFKEGGGDLSSQRLVFVIGSLYAMSMGAWVFAATHDYVALLATVPALAGVFAAGKVIQKPMEKKQDNP